MKNNEEIELEEDFNEKKVDNSKNEKDNKIKDNKANDLIKKRMKDKNFYDLDFTKKRTRSFENEDFEKNKEVMFNFSNTDNSYYVYPLGFEDIIRSEFKDQLKNKDIKYNSRFTIVKDNEKKSIPYPLSFKKTFKENDVMDRNIMELCAKKIFGKYLYEKHVKPFTNMDNIGFLDNELYNLANIYKTVISDVKKGLLSSCKSFCANCRLDLLSDKDFKNSDLVEKYKFDQYIAALCQKYDLDTRNFSFSKREDFEKLVNNLNGNISFEDNTSVKEKNFLGTKLFIFDIAKNKEKVGEKNKILLLNLLFPIFVEMNKIGIKNMNNSFTKILVRDNNDGCGILCVKDLDFKTFELDPKLDNKANINRIKTALDHDLDFDKTLKNLKDLFSNMCKYFKDGKVSKEMFEKYKDIIEKRYLNDPDLHILQKDNTSIKKIIKKIELKDFVDYITNNFSNFNIKGQRKLDLGYLIKLFSNN